MLVQQCTSVFSSNNVPVCLVKTVCQSVFFQQRGSLSCKLINEPQTLNEQWQMDETTLVEEYVCMVLN